MRVQMDFAFGDGRDRRRPSRLMNCHSPSPSSVRPRISYVAVGDRSEVVDFRRLPETRYIRRTVEASDGSDGETARQLREQRATPVAG
jgi:hypothetical protein